MEGAMRPGHFNGVAQIVSKLFKWANPTRAYFGEKDFQQIAVIRRMAQLEGFTDLTIVACPIVREADGLALSSRNVRLSPELRAKAPAIHKVLVESLEYAKTHTVAQTQQHVTDTLNAIADMEVEYYTISNPITMQAISEWSDTANPVGCITVYCGDVRLIDNITYKS
jgi:pantoate--beta-alanine ligase